MPRFALLSLFVWLGCACPPASRPGPAASPPTPIGATVPEPTLPAATLARQGGSCGPGAPCPEGLLCLSYTGVGGARGPQLATCELRCAAQEPRCPADQTCTVVADGPGRVCQHLKVQP